MPGREPSAAENLSAARVRRFQREESSDEEGVPSPANNSEPEPEPEPEPDDAEMLLLALDLERVRSQAPDEAVELPSHLDFRVSPPFMVLAGPTSHDVLDHAARSTAELAAVLREAGTLTRSMSSSPNRTLDPNRQLVATRYHDELMLLSSDPALAKMDASTRTEINRSMAALRELTRAAAGQRLMTVFTPALSPGAGRPARPVVSAPRGRGTGYTTPRESTPPRRNSSTSSAPMNRSTLMMKSTPQMNRTHPSPQSTPFSWTQSSLGTKSSLVTGGWKLVDGCACSCAFLPMLSAESFAFHANNRNVARPQTRSEMGSKQRSKESTLHPAALVAVPRDFSTRKVQAMKIARTSHDAEDPINVKAMSERNVPGSTCSLGSSEQANGAFCLAVVIEDLDPGNKWLSFGIGIDLPRAGNYFGEIEVRSLRSDDFYRKQPMIFYCKRILSIENDAFWRGPRRSCRAFTMSVIGTRGLNRGLGNVWIVAMINYDDQSRKARDWHCSFRREVRVILSFYAVFYRFVLFLC